MHHGFKPASVLALSLLCCVAAQAAERSIAIVNGTKKAMVSLSARPADAADWRAGILGHRTLGIQKQVDFAIPEKDGCVYDLRAKFEDGSTIDKNRVDLCKSKTYLLTNSF